MTWTPVTPEMVAFAEHMVLWIRTAREAGYGGGFGMQEREWLPTASDVSKSALLERIRSGKKPLPYPPPVGYACPWYAVVEDPGPHYVGGTGNWAPQFYVEGTQWMEPDDVIILQNRYKIVERTSETDMVVRDDHHNNTPYRFRLWFDPDWKHPTAMRERPPGGWFLQNMEFAGRP